MKTIDYLNALNWKFAATDYKIGKMLKLSTASISAWRQGKGGASDETALKIAELLGIDAAVVLADIRIEHCKNEEVKSAWLRAREIIRRSVAALLLIFVTSGGMLSDAVCVLCQIGYRVRRGTFGGLPIRVFSPIFPHVKKTGLNHEQKTTHPLLGRLLHGCRFYLHANRREGSPQSDRPVLLHGQSSQTHRGGITRVARTWASTGFGFIFIAGACSAEGRLAVGTLSHHTGSIEYYERNAALCWQSSFERYVHGCYMPKDSHKDGAFIGGIGERKKITNILHVGYVLGLKLGANVGGLFGATVGLGDEHFNTEVLIFPKTDSKPGLAYLTFGKQF